MRGPRRDITREAAILFGIGGLLAAVVAAVLAADQRFLGTYGDSQQLLWQARNLLEFARTGDSIVTDAFFGVPNPMAYMPTSLGEGIFVLFFRWVTGNPWFAVNLGTLLGLVANLTSMYLCLRILDVRLPAALLGGFMFMMAPQTLVQALSGHMWFAWTFLIPPLLLLIRFAGKDAPRWWWPALGLVTGFFVWVHEYYALFAALITIPLGVITLVRQRPVDLRKILIAVVGFALVIAPAFWIHIERRQFDLDNNIYAGQDALTATRFSSDPLDFLQPTETSLLYIGLPDGLTQGYETEPLNYLGVFSLLGLVGIAVPGVRRAMTDHQRALLVRAAPMVVAAVVLSFGTKIPTDGSTPGPAELFYRFDIYPFTQITSWGRYGVFGFAVFAALVAIVASALLRRASRIATIAVVMVAMTMMAVDQYPYFTLITHRSPAPEPLIEEIRNSPDDGFVLHVPLDPHHAYRYNAMAQFLQTFHDRPIVNGYMPYADPEYGLRLTKAPFGCMRTQFRVRCPADEIVGDALRDEDIAWLVFDRFQTAGEIGGFIVTEHPLTVAERLREIEALIGRLETSGYVERIYDDESYGLYRVVDG